MQILGNFARIDEVTALISINETLIIQLISFLIFLFIINKIMFRPLNGIMKERVDYMDDLKKNVVDAENEMARLTDKLTAQETAARQEALSQRKELEDRGSEKATEIFASAKDEILELKNKAAKEVEAQIINARNTLKAEAENLSVGIMEKILDRRLAQ